MASGERAPEGNGKKNGKKASAAERTSKFFRDINVLGAVAIGGAALLAPPVAAGALGLWAGVNAAQAAGFEVARKHFAKKRKKKDEHSS